MKGQRVFRRLTVAEVGPWCAAHPNALLLDTRDAASHARDGWPGAVRLCSDNQDDLLLRTARTRPLLIYCYHGNASQTWAQMFADFGFTEVSDLIGGQAAWVAAQSAPAPAAPHRQRPHRRAGHRHQRSRTGCAPKVSTTPTRAARTATRR
jgi:rhodanese-related sulfurtransferase